MLSAIGTFVSGLMYPPFCPGCRCFVSQEEVLCADCLAALRLVLTRDISLGSGRVLSVYAVARYEGVLQKLIRAKNYRQRTAAWQLGELVALHAPCPWDRFDLVIPVPLHWSRTWWRGFNQAKVMAQCIAQIHRKELLEPVARVKRTIFQAEVGSVDRRIANVQGAFAFVSDGQKKQCKGKSFLIVDDVVTTGSTVIGLAKLLYHAGAEHVGVVVAARG